MATITTTYSSLPEVNVEKGAPALRLLDAPHDRWHRIRHLNGPKEECQRLLDLGLTPGEEIAVVQSVPLGDPMIVLVRGTRLALRRREAAWIWVQ